MNVCNMLNKNKPSFQSSVSIWKGCIHIVETSLQYGYKFLTCSFDSIIGNFDYLLMYILCFSTELDGKIKDEGVTQDLQNLFMKYC